MFIDKDFQFRVNISNDFYVKKTEAHKKAMSAGKKKAKQRRLRQERKLQRQQQQQSLNSAA